MAHSKKHPSSINVKVWLGGFFVFLSIIVGILVTIATLQSELEGFVLIDLFASTGVWLSHPSWLWLSVLAVLMMICTSALRLWMLLHSSGHPIPFLTALRYGILSRYYVLITPWGLGGQPIMMGIMHKEGVPFAQATAIPMLDLFFMRFAMAILTTIAFFGIGNLLDPYLFVFALVGYFFTSFLPVVLILFSFHPSFSRFFVGLIRQYWFKRTAVSVAKKVEEAFSLYQHAFGYYKKKIGSLMAVFLSSVVSQLSLLIIPFFILSSFVPVFIGDNLPSFQWTQLVQLMAMTNTMLGVVPTIGSAGAAEFTFSAIFSRFVVGQELFWVTFIWRFFVFYGWLVLGLVVLILRGVLIRKKAVPSK